MPTTPVFEPPGPPPADVADTAIELGRGLGAEVLVACAVERHPRYGGEDFAPAESAVEEVVDRLQARGVAARSEVSRVLAGAGPRVLAADVTEFGADLLIVDDHGTPGPLRALGLGLAGRPAPEVPRPGPAAPAARAAPRLRVVR